MGSQGNVSLGVGGWLWGMGKEDGLELKEMSLIVAFLEF